MIRKELGKINSVHFGLDGDGRFGLRVELKLGDGGCVGDHIGYRAEYPKFAQYPITVWEEARIEAWERIQRLMTEAKVTDLYKLRDVPIEANIENNTLRGWRILTEVL